MPADPKDLAARPAFLGLLARLRGWEEKCRRCKGGGKQRPVLDTAFRCVRCWHCSGSGRAAVPPDPDAALVLADWWQDDGQDGDLAGLLWCYALGTPRGLVLARRRGEGRVIAAPEEDDSLRPVLAAWGAFACPPRAEAVRGLRVKRGGLTNDWYLLPRVGGREFVFYSEPAARLALKRAALACYDPGGPYDGGAGVWVPMRAEGARLTVRHHAYGREHDWPHDALPFGVRVTPADLAYEHRLDGARVGAPPDWSWTPHALPGGRLAITWEAWPSALLPAADAGGRTSSGARHVRVDLEDLRR